MAKISDRFAKIFAAMLLLLISTPARSAQVVDYLEDFETGSFGSWQFTGSTNGQQSGDAGVCPGNWHSSVVGNSLEGAFSAEIYAQSTNSCAPWIVVASAETTTPGAPRLGMHLRFDDIQGTGGVGNSFFDIVIINAANVSEFFRYRFSTTADFGGDEIIAVSPGEEMHFVRHIGGDYFSKHGQPLPDEIILQFRANADYAEGGTGTRTTHVRVDSIILVGDNPHCPEADLNNDCNVDLIDALIMANGWLGAGPLADIQPAIPDDWVNQFDFSLLASQWASSGIVSSLSPGLNLVSIPVRGNTTSLPDLLASIDGKYRSVFSYDLQNAGSPWESFVSDRPIYLDALPRIDTNQGFWVDMTEAADLAVAGSSLDGTEFPIQTGWNLVSYPSTTAQAVGTAILGVADVIESVHEYDAANTESEWTSYETASPGSATLTNMRPGFGYWVKATADDLWIWQQDKYMRKHADVLVTHVLVSPVVPMLLPGQTQKNVTLTIGVSNTEKIAVSQVRVQVYDETGGGSVLLKDTTLPSIGPESFEEFTVVDIFNGGNHPLRIVVDPFDTVAEEDETNNEFVYNLAILNAATASAAMNPTSGEVPIKIDFSGTASDGLPPYVHAWLRQEDGALFNGQNVPLIYSTTGAKQMTYLVADSLADGAFGFSDVDTLNFSLSANTLGTPVNFGIDIYDVDELNSSEAEVFINISNSVAVSVPKVRVTVKIFDPNDLSTSRVLYDDLRSLGANDSQNFSLIAGNLQLTDYTVTATINEFGAVPETDSANPINNFDAYHFTFNGLGYLPEIQVTRFDIDEQFYYPDQVVTLQSIVRNNDNVTRALRTRYSWHDGSQYNAFAISPAAIVESTAEVSHNRLFKMPRQLQTPILMEVLDLVDPNRVVGRGIISATPTAYDFKIAPNLTFESPDPNSHRRELPLRVIGQVTNLSTFGGEINYRLYIDSDPNAATEPRTVYLEAGETQEISFGLRWWSSIDNVSIGQTVYSLSSQIAGPHAFEIRLESVEAGTALESLFDSNATNNSATGATTIQEFYDFAIEGIFFGGGPRLNQRTGLGARITNNSNDLDPCSFDVRITDSWFSKDDGHWVSIEVLDEQISVESGATSYPDDPNWTPLQAGTHRIRVECEAADQSLLIHEVNVTIGLGLIELETGHIFDLGNSEGVYDLKAWTVGDEIERVMPFTKATANAADVTDPNTGNLAQSRIAAGMYKKFVVDDGSSTTDDWWDIDLIFDGTFVGIIDSMSYGVFPNLWAHSYLLSIQVGVVSDNGPVSFYTEELSACPEDHTTPWDLTGGCAHYLPPYSSHPLDDIVETFAWPVVETIVTEEASNVARLLYPLEKVIDYVSCKEVIIGEGSFNMGRMRVRNGVPFSVFIRMYGAVEAFTPDLLTETYITFSDQEAESVPCDENFSMFEGTSYPLRGLSIDNVSIVINSVPE